MPRRRMVHRLPRTAETDRSRVAAAGGVAARVLVRPRGVRGGDLSSGRDCAEARAGRGATKCRHHAGHGRGQREPGVVLRLRPVHVARAAPASSLRRWSRPGPTSSTSVASRRSPTSRSSTPTVGDRAGRPDRRVAAATHPDVVISVDTYKPTVVEASLAAGASIINDVSGLLYPEVVDVLRRARRGPGHHAHGGAAQGATARPGPLRRRRRRGRRLPGRATDGSVIGLGLPRESVILDPGPDFTKTPHQTVAVLRGIDDVRDLGRPVLLALSRKDFLGAITGRSAARTRRSDHRGDRPLRRRPPATSCACTTSPPPVTWWRRSRPSPGLRDLPPRLPPPGRDPARARCMSSARARPGTAPHLVLRTTGRRSGVLPLKGYTSVAVVIPARNEEATVGLSYGASDAQDLPDLVDELVVMDSLSSDGTAAEAAAAGAGCGRSEPSVRTSACGRARARPCGSPSSSPRRTCSCSSTRTSRAGAPTSSPASSAHCWQPGDASGQGLLRPRPGYRARESRPRGVGSPNSWRARGSPCTGRRCPPSVQPLAGEWAIRRSLFSSLSVPVGYGVELATLLDTESRHGVDAISQVDLGSRSHTHQNLHDLGAMATELLAVADRRRTLSAGPSYDQVDLRRLTRDRAWTTRAVVTAERPSLDSVREGAEPALPTGLSWPE